MVKKIVVMILAIMTSTLMLSSCLEDRVWAKIRESIDLAKYDNMQTVEFDKNRYYDAIAFLLAIIYDEEDLNSFYEEYSDIINSTYYSELASQALQPEDGENGFSEDTSYEGYVEGKGYPIYESDGERIGYGSFDEYQDTLHWFEEAPSIWVYSANFYNDCIFAYVFDKYCQEKQYVLIHLDSELKITGYEVF